MPPRRSLFSRAKFPLSILGGTLAGILIGLVGEYTRMPEWVALVVAASSAVLFVGLGAHRKVADDKALLREEIELEARRHEETRAFIQRILDVIPMPVYVKDADGHFLLVNEAQARSWERSAESLIGQNLYEFVKKQEDVPRIRNEDLRVLAGERVIKEECSNPDCAPGDEQYRVVTKGSCLDIRGRPVVVCAFFETTEWRLAERRLQEAFEHEQVMHERSREFMQAVIDAIPDMILIKDATGITLMVNAATCSAYGMTHEELVGLDSFTLPGIPAPEPEVREEDRRVIAGEIIDKEAHYISPLTGQEVFSHITKRRCIALNGKPAIVVAYFNITRWKVAERNLVELAANDALTGLRNRRSFLEAAQAGMSHCERRKEPLSALLLDIDHFKRINDTHGHHMGDLALTHFAQVLRETLRTEDVAARWGGEEFILLIPGNVAQGTTLATRIHATLAARPLRSGTLVLPLTCSIGVTGFRPGESIEALITRADLTMYRAKQEGRNTTRVSDT